MNSAANTGKSVKVGCGKCDGKGRLSWTAIANGVCFACEGTGKGEVMNISAKTAACDTESVPDESIAVGDMVYVLGWKRIVRIRPYTGPLDCVLAIADTDTGVGFSLCRGDTTTRRKV